MWLGAIAIFCLTSGTLAPVARAAAQGLWRAEAAMAAALALALVSAVAPLQVPRA